MEESRPAYALHLKSMLTCIEAKQKGLTMTTKQMHTFHLTSSPIEELYIFRMLIPNVRAVIDDFHEKNSALHS